MLGRRIVDVGSVVVWRISNVNLSDIVSRIYHIVISVGEKLGKSWSLSVPHV